MVELRNITSDNFNECVNLKVSEHQRSFVASNVYSLAQAWESYETAYPFAIYADDVMVGFVMMGYYTEKNLYTIWRFMIDERYQNKGYGKAALQLAIDYLIKRFDINEIFLSYEPDNIIAEKLYSSFGFKRTGEIDNGEIVMRLEIKKNDIRMNTITIDFNQTTGKIKPMHAINNTPYVPGGESGLYKKIKEANIPYARLHDTGGQFGGSRYVDIENIFTDFNADENDPASYDFAFTDALLSSMDKIGLKPFYRLGCSYETNHKIKAYHIYPPADPYKWARICEHIIMHYNGGWADGFNYGIEYWEIWNEPDNEPDMYDNPMWRGTQEQFFELYDIAAKHLKARFPDLKIGGYASCGFYAISEADFSETAHSTSRVGYFIEFFHNFMRYISERRSPLDFFSWHSYAGIKENVMYAEYAKEKLAEYGYGDIEVIFNEWNPGTHNRGKTIDASNIAAMMCAMQKTSTDMCMYYDGQARSNYCGLYSGDWHKVFKAYYTFRAFGELYMQKNEVLSETNADGIYTCAAAGDRNLALIVNSNAESCDIKLNAPDIIQCIATDEIHEYESIEIELNDGILTLPPYAVWLVTFK